MKENNTRTAGTTRRNVLKMGAGAAAASIVVPVMSGTAAAHFHGPDKPYLDIDIKPESDKNHINPNSGGSVPVAVIQTDTFDPTSENVNYRFGAPDVVEDGDGARPLHDGHVQNVDGDGKCDLVLHFPMKETGFNGDEKFGNLHWEEGHKGAHHGLGGSDRVTIVGGKEKSNGSSNSSSDQHSNSNQHQHSNRHVGALFRRPIHSRDFSWR
jgi:hypothetical protein